MTDPRKGSTGLTFAQSLEQKRGPATGAAPRALQATPTYALAALVGLTCATLLVQTRPDLAQTAPAAKKQSAAKPARRVQVAMGERDAAPAKAAQPASRPSLDFYTKGVRGSLFTAPQPPAPKTAAVATKKLPTPKVPVFPVNPFADWTYSGTVTSGDKKMALLENRYTKEGRYVQVGENFGPGLGTVKAVTDQMVTVVSTLDKKPHMLAKSDTVNVTPLVASAGYLTQKPQDMQQQMQQGAQTPQQFMMMAAMQAQMAAMAAAQPAAMTLPNGQQLSARQAARFTQRMNGRFNGGGAGGGGLGGGGFGGGGGRRGRGGGGMGGG